MAVMRVNWIMSLDLSFQSPEVRKVWSEAFKLPWPQSNTRPNPAYDVHVVKPRWLLFYFWRVASSGRLDRSERRVCIKSWTGTDFVFQSSHIEGVDCRINNWNIWIWIIFYVKTHITCIFYLFCQGTQIKLRYAKSCEALLYVTCTTLNEITPSVEWKKNHDFKLSCKQT